jgi:hypothetical protein
VSADNRVAPQEPRQSFWGARLGIAAAGGLALLALVETAQALISPTRAPTDLDWRVTAAQLRVGFQTGDLIVVAPPWADPVMRMHVGDLLPIPVAARMDDARFGRVWEISQRGGHAVEMRGRAVTFEQRFGALTLRRAERRPAEITFDFLERWQDAYVTRWDPAARASVPCPWQVDRFGCPLLGNSVKRALVEVDTQIRRAIVAPPVRDAIIAIEFQSVPLGRELAVAVGLHDAWARKSSGSVYFEVWIAGRPALGTVVDNRSGWRTLRVDTTARNGQVAPVRFQISSPRPDLRYLAFAAEARR